MEEARKTGGKRGERASRLVTVLLALLALVPLSGCWDQNEVGNVGFILAAGMDAYEDDGIRLTLQVFVPNPTDDGGGQGGEGRLFTFSDVGASLPEALTAIQIHVPRVLSWDHAKMILLGESLAERGIQDEFDFLFRDIEPREQASFFVCKGTCSQILQSLDDPNSYDTIIRITNMPVVSTYNMNYVEEMMTGESQAFVLPEAATSTMLASTSRKHILTVNGKAVMKNGKLAGWLDHREALGLYLGFQWLHPKKQAKNIMFTIKENGGKITAELVAHKLKLIPSIEHGVWKMKVRLRLDADIVQNSSNLDIFRVPGALRALQPRFEEAIEEILRLPAHKAQRELNVDVLGFARAFHKKYPKEWEKVSGQWYEKFRGIEVTYDVHCRLRKAGIASLKT